jgi:site-specific DNA-cytosine methylase
MRLDPTSETFPIAPTLQAHDGEKWGSNQWVDEGKAIVERVAETLMASDYKGPGHNRDHNFVAQPMAFPWQSALDPIGNPENLSGTLIKNQTMAVAQPTYGIPGNWIGRQPENGGNAVEPMHDVSPCLTKTDRHGVAQPTASAETAGTLRANAGSGFRSNGTPVEGVAIQAMQVRRLTPVECERLQGFPDGYTNIPWRNKAESPDGPRYKAMGNSMAVPVMRWIGERIAAVEAL